MQDLPTSPLRTRFQAYSVLICLAGMALLLFYVLRFAGGHFVYTLDDPYIHLSLAENLLRGHYGVNIGEVASPSSSIIYPFLLAITLALGLGEFGPMVLNLIGAVGATWILTGVLWDALHKDSTGQVSAFAYVAAPVLLFALNGYALAFTGMEHSRHIFVSLCIVVGLLRVSRTSPPGIALLIAIVAAPLLRFEGFALAGAALVALALMGHWTRAITTGVIIVALVAGYMALMTSLGLPLMPSSVMVKSGPAAAMATSHFTSIFGEVWQSLRESLQDRQGIVMAIAVALLLAGAVLNKSDPNARTVALVAAAASVAHLLVGRWNWFGRYEVYIVATALAALLIVWRPWLSAAARRMTAPILIILLAPVVGSTYIYVTYLTPTAAQNVYEQQYQMHRFATEYFPESVAVNDLGWVTFQNESYVLDLWGLGSETARKTFSTQGRTPDAISQLTDGAGVTYAMVYERAFAGLPADWCRMAQLRTTQVTSSYDTVEFFLIDPAKSAAMRAALDAFAPTVPGAATLEIFDCPKQ